MKTHSASKRSILALKNILEEPRITAGAVSAFEYVQQVDLSRLINAVDTVSRISELSLPSMQAYSEAQIKPIASALDKFTVNFNDINRSLVSLATVSVADVTPYVSNINQATQIIENTWKKFNETNSELVSNFASITSLQNGISNKVFKTLMDSQVQQIDLTQKVFTEKIREIPQYPSKIIPTIQRKISGSREELKRHLHDVRRSIEEEGQYILWESKSKDKLYKRPENIAQGTIASMLRLVLPKKNYVMHQHPHFGPGIIDIAISFYNGDEMETVLLELKVFEDGHDFTDGINQTFLYLESQELLFGYRIIFNATKNSLSEDTHLDHGMELQDLIININQESPSTN